ncbi:nuclease HARBI1-like protein [Aphelenchoides avenae]|nr:nuclease HARBI1-like protein [Aphelenchus avenae]
MMKPYPAAAANASLRKRVYNYRLCRARRVIENVFGIMAAKWRILLGTIATSPELADDIVEAICCLHNFIIDTSPESSLILADKGDDDNGRWRQEVHALPQAPVHANRANRASDAAMEMREALVGYFSGEGALDWQVDHIAREDGALPETDDEGDVQDDATVAGDE